MTPPLRLAFLGCGWITHVHSRYLRRLGEQVRLSYASRDGAKAESFRRRYGGDTAYGSYVDALADPAVDVVLVAVPPTFHRDLALRALSAGKHVIVEKPAFPTMADFQAVQEARDRAGRIVMVAENDHYKPLAVRLRQLLAEGVVGPLVFAQFTTIAHRFKQADDWRNDEAMAGGDAFFEEGIHWLHIAGSLGPRIVTARGYRPPASRAGADRRAKSMLVAFEYDNRAVGAIYYSREVPAFFQGLSLSKLCGRDGVIAFESNGAFILARGRGLPRAIIPGFRDIRGYAAMHRDFLQAMRDGRAPEMSLERAIEDQALMDQIYATVGDDCAAAADVAPPPVA